MLKKCLILLSVLLFACGCTVHIGPGRTLTGSGETVTVTQTAPTDQPYRLIIRDLNCAIGGTAPRLQLSANASEGVAVCTQQNIADTLTVQIDRLTHTITVCGDADLRYHTDTLHILCGLPVDDLEIRTALTLTDCRLSGTDPSLKISGAAEGNITVDGADSFTVSISGAGSLQLNGTAQKAAITVNGAADLNARQLLCHSTEITVNGAASCKIYADESLKATLNGSGVIRYDGQPQQVEQTVNGLGSIAPQSQNN